MLKEIDKILEVNKLMTGYDPVEFRGDRSVLRKLPLWCRKLVSELDVSSWGLYKYTMYMTPLKDDPRVKNAKAVEDVVFRADTLKELIDNIEMYKRNYSRIDYDY